MGVIPTSKEQLQCESIRRLKVSSGATRQDARGGFSSPTLSICKYTDHTVYVGGRRKWDKKNARWEKMCVLSYRLPFLCVASLCCSCSQPSPSWVGLFIIVHSSTAELTLVAPFNPVETNKSVLWAPPIYFRGSTRDWQPITGPLYNLTTLIAEYGPNYDGLATGAICFNSYMRFSVWTLRDAQRANCSAYVHTMVAFTSLYFTSMMID